MIIAITDHYKLKQVKLNFKTMQKKDKVFKLFHKSVPESKKYTAKAKSKKTFDTKEEADAERLRLYTDGNHNRNSLKIMMLYTNKKL